MLNFGLIIMVNILNITRPVNSFMSLWGEFPMEEDGRSSVLLRQIKQFQDEGFFSNALSCNLISVWPDGFGKKSPNAKKKVAQNRRVSFDLFLWLKWLILGPLFGAKVAQSDILCQFWLLWLLKRHIFGTLFGAKVAQSGNFFKISDLNFLYNIKN